MKHFHALIVSVLCGLALIATPAIVGARDRVPLEKLTADEQKSVKTCSELLKKIAETHQKEDRATEAQLLLEAVKPLNNSQPDFFRAWVWRAQAALVLGTKDDALKALENMVQLGVAKNKDPRVLGVVYAIQKRGWASGDSPNAANDSAPAESEAERAERQRSLASKMARDLAKTTATPAPKADREKDKPSPKVDRDGFVIQGN